MIKYQGKKSSKSLKINNIYRIEKQPPHFGIALVQSLLVSCCI